MKFIVLCLIPLLLLQLHSIKAAERPSVDEQLAKFLQEVNQRLAVLYNKEVLASWQNEVNGPNNLVALLQSEIATKDIINYLKSISTRVAKFKRLYVKDESLRRQLLQIPEVGYEALEHEDLLTMYAVTSNMSEVYRSAKLCAYNQSEHCDLSLLPDVQNILHESTDVQEIEYYWLEWRRKTGLAARADFGKFVELYRKTAKLNGFSIPSDFWFKDLEENSTETLKLLQKFMTDLQPYFQQFHAHVRASLRQLYGAELIPESQPYPQNLAEIFIGNAYRNSNSDWFTELPYPEVSLANVTAGLLERGLNNPQRVFWNVVEYFRGLGFPQLEPGFFTYNAKPKSFTEREYATCWHKAWKYYGLNQVNFSYCNTVNEEKFFNMFEALSDVYYIRAYQSQPTLFEEEPFPNFSDGVGKFFSLAASSPKLLEKWKLIGEGYTTHEARINRLYLQGMRTIFLLPIFYVLDRYRVEILDGSIDISNNCEYWALTELYTGAEPPIIRSNADFDAPAKLLMEVDDQYTSQLMSMVLQFQLYKHFCELTGQYVKGDPLKPLDLCDLSNQRQVGESVLAAMSLGSSKPYAEVLRLMTNETELRLDGMLEYFSPLYDWLLEKNRNDSVEIGWEKSNKCQP